jgi:acetylornithine deacetylase/succinyl-diaminopimelate desuccinylase-like protein
VRLIAVVDEEVGGTEGAVWLCRERPDLARVDFLLNEGGGQVMPYGDRRLYGLCCAEKGTFRFRVTARGVAGHASVPGFGDNALVKLAPVLEALASTPMAYDVTEGPRRLLETLGLDPEDPAAAVAAIAEVEPRLATMVEPTLRVTAVPTMASGSATINVIPARAELIVDARVPPGMDGEPAMRRIREVLGDDLDIAFTEQVTGNASPFDSPLRDAIASWLGEQDPGAELVPTALPAFTDSRTFRDAFPDCAAYGFFPQRHQSFYETWPLIHSADERIDVRDLAFAASFFHELPERLLR